MRRELKKFIIVIAALSLVVYGSPRFSTKVHAKKTVIALDAGHGNNDPGAYNTFSGDLYFEEADWAILAVKKAKEMFESKGYKVVLCSSTKRSKEPRTDLGDRVDKAVQEKAVVFVSFHYNATASTTTNYPMVVTDDNASNKSKKLAKIMYHSLIDSYGENFYTHSGESYIRVDSTHGNGGFNIAVTADKSYDFASILIEPAFVTSKKVCEMQKKDKSITDKTAEAVVNAVLKYLGEQGNVSVQSESDTVVEAGAKALTEQQEFMADKYNKHTLSNYDVGEVSMNDLTIEERTMIRGIQNYIYNRSYSITGKIRVALVFSGFIFSIYGLLLFLCFWLDRYNVTKEFQLLKFVSFGRYEIGLDEDKCIGTRYVNLKKAIMILLSSVFISVFILSGKAFEFLDFIFKFIIDIFS